MLGSCFLFVALIFLATGCLHNGGDSVKTDTGLKSAATLVEEYTIERGQSMQALDEWVLQGESSIDVFAPYVTDPDPKKRWLAVYVIGRVGTPDSVQPLLPLLDDDNETVRVAAAGTLANKGYSEALPVLMAGLNSTGVIEYVHPQGEIAEFCREVLTTYTGQNFATVAEWEQWWAEQGASVLWDDAAKLYQ